MTKLLDKIIVIALLTMLPNTASAQIQNGSPGFDFKNPLSVDSIPALIAKILEFVVKVGTVIAVFAVIYSGFKFITAQGNDSKITEAKSIFFWTIIGALILIGAQVLSVVICNTANGLGAGAQCK